MKNVIAPSTIILVLLTFSCKLVSQTENNELIILNENPTDTLLISVEPVGFIFAGDKSYQPISRFNSSHYIFGGIKKIFINPLAPTNKRFSLNHDALAIPSTSDGLIGYGKYRVLISLSVFDSLSGNYYFQSIDTVFIDYSDSDYPYGPFTNWPRYAAPQN